MEMFDTTTKTPQPVYTSLAAKYRPQTFEEVVGQAGVSKTLMNALKSGRIAHAYLFYGPRGCGKTTTARLLAKALNCTGDGNTKPTAHPCGHCPQCLEIAASSDMDVLELDAASNTQVERVREAIIDTVGLAAGRDRFKVFILDEVHMLSASSFNALLKTIEEPPSHVVFILATTELHKVPLTISSRCQTFRFKPIGEADISAHLLDLANAENIELEEGAAKIIAKSAGGALRDALTMLDRAIAFSDGKISTALVAEMLGILPQDLVQKALLALVNKDSLGLHKVFETVQNEGFEAQGLLKDLKDALGDIFYLSLNAGKEPFVGAKDLLKEMTPGYFAALTRKISKLIDEVNFSDTPALSAEVGLFTIMDSSLDIEGLINRLEVLGENIQEDADDDSGLGLEDNTAEKKTLNNFTEPKPASKTPKTEAKELKNDIEDEPSSVLATPPMPKATQNTDTPAAWQKFKTALANKYPFLFEAVQDTVFTSLGGDIWQLNFKARDSFFKDTVARRLKDFEDLSRELFGVKISFKLILDEPAEKPAVKTIKSNAAQKDAAPAQQKQNLILDEEAFVEGDFSAYAVGGEQEKKENQAKQETQKTQIKTPAEIDEAAQMALDIFEGQVVEAI
ncbi:MAG: DNA polymerase III subunit gamma/tau [Elusimicrobiota bacterium]|jgi:DNA polymerase-3 subunit gamma/tau|nr:DNA polymerase III subunit gamma/tau [Elusimicrobiota bacterium]